MPNDEPLYCLPERNEHVVAVATSCEASCFFIVLAEHFCIFNIFLSIRGITWKP